MPHNQDILLYISLPYFNKSFSYTKWREKSSTWFFKKDIKIYSLNLDDSNYKVGNNTLKVWLSLSLLTKYLLCKYILCIGAAIFQDKIYNLGQWPFCSTVFLITWIHWSGNYCIEIIFAPLITTAHDPLGNFFLCA